MSYLITGVNFKDVDVVYFVYLQYVHNGSRSKNNNVSKKEKTEDIPYIQPITYVRLRLLIQPLCILHTKQKDIQWDGQCKESQTKTNLTYFLCAHKLLLLLPFVKLSA
jgi:hypothetical protein